MKKKKKRERSIGLNVRRRSPRDDFFVVFSMTNSDPAAVTVEFLGGWRSRFCRIDLTTEAAVLVILGRSIRFGLRKQRPGLVYETAAEWLRVKVGTTCRIDTTWLHSASERENDHHNWNNLSSVERRKRIWVVNGRNGVEWRNRLSGAMLDTGYDHMNSESGGWWWFDDEAK